MNESPNKSMKQLTTIALSVIIGLLSGVGATQMWIVGDVRKHEVQIESAQRDIKDTKASFEQRMDNIIRLWEAQLATERELIQLVRMQNELLQRKQ